MKVRTGSSSGQIVIVIRQSPTSDCVLVWDTNENQEIDSFDVSPDPKIFWDAQGNAQITE